jgi:predicted Na+-dependent transporter
MIKFFGLPILIAFFLGYLIPYSALALSPYAFIILFLMMTSSTVDSDWSSVFRIREYRFELIAGLFFLFFFFPLLQWFPARYLIREESLFYGATLASLCPVAIVAPNFTKIQKGDEVLSFLLMIASMIFFPFIVWLALSLTNQTLHLKPIIIDMALLVLLPLIASALLKMIDKKFPFLHKWKKISAEFNMFSIAVLAFIYLGASVSKLNLSYTPKVELVSVLGIIFFQDFGIYFISRLVFTRLFDDEKAEALAVSLSMKNLAVSGAILLFYDPKASLASALGFFVHALFFNFLAVKKTKT